MEYFSDFFISAPLALSYFVQIAIAYILSFPIGWNRESKTRSAGLRTFPLVAVATCGYMLISIHYLDDSQSVARVMYGIITGIGFIGGGAILKSGGSVKGTATSASIWNIGAIGIAVACKRIEIALVLSLINFLTLSLIGPIKEKVIKKNAQSKED